MYEFDFLDDWKLDPNNIIFLSDLVLLLVNISRLRLPAGFLHEKGQCMAIIGTVHLKTFKDRLQSTGSRVS